MASASDATGALVVHGFTGTPATMGPVVDALRAAGFTVSAPTLPGHGTRIEDMVPTRWSDWSAAVAHAYAELAPRVERVAVAGISMGATLALWLAARHPEVAGLALVNPLAQPPDPALRQLAVDMLAAGEEIAPAVGSDLADPEATEVAYEGSPIAPLLSLFDAVEELQDDLPRVTCPVLLLTSVEDHVVDPVNSDHLAGLLGGPVTRVRLERSYHVATLDHDRDLIAARTVDFFRSLSTNG